jgi:hypothetical protein
MLNDITQLKAREVKCKFPVTRRILLHMTKYSNVDEDNDKLMDNLQNM